MKRILLLKFIFFLSVSHAITVNDLARELAKVMQPSLPMPVTKNISINRVFPTYDSTVFMINTINDYADYQQAEKDENEYIVDDYKKLKHLAKQKLLKTMCTLQSNREYIYMGLKLHIQYVSHDDYPLFDYHIEESDCVENEIPPKKKLSSLKYLWAKANYTINLMPFIRSLPPKENQAFLLLLKNKYESLFTNQLKNTKSKDEYYEIMRDINFNYLLLSKLTNSEELANNYTELRDLFFDMKYGTIKKKEFLSKLNKINTSLDIDMNTKNKIINNYLPELKSTHKFIRMMILEAKK